MNDNDWAMLVGSIRDGECVVFLGAGASTVPDGEVGLPTGGEVSQRLAVECGYPGSDKSDFLRVCQYFELVQDGHHLRKCIIRKLTLPGLKPGKLHAQIAALPIKYVLTTNYDRLMETAFQMAGKQPLVGSYDLNGPTQLKADPVTETAPLVYKLHGSIDEPASMLCTEDDIVQFLSCITLGDPPIPSTVKQLFESNTFLFVGYGLKDWNIRTMIRAMRRRRQKDWVRSFAVQRRPQLPDAAADWESSVMYWDRKENVRCVDVEAIPFMDELVRRFKDIAGR